MWKLKILIQFILALLPGGERINFILQKLNKSYSPEKIQERILATAQQLVCINEFLKIEESVVLR